MSPAPKKRPVASRTVSDQLRAIIRGRGMTPYAVAQLAGVAPSIVSRFVNRERGLTTDTFDRVADALGLELRETRRGARGRPTTGDRVRPADSPTGPPP